MDGDTISRKVAIDTVLKVKIADEGENLVECQSECNAMVDCAVKELEKLPSVQPEQKRGKWINHGQYADFFPHIEYRCSECDTPYLEIEMTYNYCPNCGARMEE